MKSFGTDVAETRKLYDLGNAQVELDYRVDTFNALIGQTLLIDLGETMEAGQQISIAVEYQTRKNGTAFSLLTAVYTASGALPYMYTQCEDINCRTVAPL